MKAEKLVKERHPFPDGISCAEIMIWKVPIAVEGSNHGYKYSLAFIVEDVCILRYDHERAKGDHRHCGDIEEAYQFKDIDTLLADFRKDIKRWRNEYGKA